MLVKIQAFLQRFNPHSKVFIIGVFSAIFLILILVTVGARINQENQSRTVQPTPTPRVLIPGKDYAEGQISVKFEDGLADVAINDRLLKYNARIKSTISGINVKVVTVPVGQEEEIRKQLIEEGIVKYAELDYMTHTQFTPNDTDFGKQYGLSNTGQSIKGQIGVPDADIHIKNAWDSTKGTGIKVAVIDTGIDLNHTDLASKVVAQKVFMTNSIDDKFGHGTHVAGVLGAVTNNTQGIAGACPECSLMIIKALDDSGNGPYSTIAQGITWASDNGAQIINMSLGGYDADNTLREAVDYSWSKGVIIVAAAGNDNSSNKFYPAGYPKTVSVAALDNKNQKASFSNHGGWVTVTAPGKSIYSTLPTHQYALQSVKGTALSYDYLDGTSMATPMVSGVVALIWSTSPGISNQAVIDRLYNSADKITGTGTHWQKGRVNAASAVGAGSITPSVSPTAGPTITQGPSVTMTPTATIGPTDPVPTFVCGGSPDSICNTPTPTRGITPTPTPTDVPIVTTQPSPVITQIPTTAPTIVPDDPCLDPRDSNFGERIRDWVNQVRQIIGDFINIILGNPTSPRPERPNITRPCIRR